MTLFRLEGVSFRALEAVDAELPGPSSCVWGPSGSGKSTLLRLLNRLADPARGRVLFEERDVRELDPLVLRRRVVLVQQLPVPMPGTVLDNVAYGARLLRRHVDVRGLLERVGLPPSYADRDARRLSVGEQQRVMLARALAIEPDVLLLDEPTSALDGRARAQVEETLAHVRRDLGTSLVLVTHDRAQAERLADHVVELRRGRVRVAA
ncbi:MAG TPA: ATP-binding cassette domain-containing protein [Gaiellaceae bacterium]|nr:ATP-binding cassette domain-containing protein [Gaiellaceae bacterium]